MRNEFRKLNNLVARNIQIYFKDKMMFFCSLITPLILIVLFLTFLGTTYKQTLLQFLPEGVELSKNLVNGFTGGWLFSSILATSSLTVAFCSNIIIMDKINKVNQDFQIAPVNKTTIQISYVIANFLSTLIICTLTVVIGFIYLAIVGWYLSVLDVLMIFVTMIIAILFGTLLSSLVWLFVSSQGALSAICTLVSSMYGFLCGAYMPISQFAVGIQNFVSFIPGTYATVLFRQYFLNGAIEEIGKKLPSEVVSEIRKSFDGTFFFFGHEVPTWAMFLVISLSVVVLFGIFVLCIYLKNRKKKNIKDKNTATK